MVKKMTPGRADIELFVECLFNQYGHILLKEEHITRTDKLKGYREYENGDEVKRELADMLERFVTKYESSDYVRDVRFHASNKEGLSNYIDVTFNTPFGAKEWLKHMSIRASDHYQRKGREKKKVDEYIDLNGKSVADIEKDLDRIINKRIRRLEREFNAPMAQNESLRGKRIMKLSINESTDKNLFINEVNNINGSNESNSIKISKISGILDKLDIGYVIDLAPNQNGAITHFTKINSYKWEDFPYTYGTYDIADEIVNGRLNTVIDIWNSDKVKSVMPKKKSDDIFLRRSGWNI